MREIFRDLVRPSGDFVFLFGCTTSAPVSRWGPIVLRLPVLPFLALPSIATASVRSSVVTVTSHRLRRQLALPRYALRLLSRDRRGLPNLEDRLGPQGRRRVPEIRHDPSS